jgi:acetylornithine/LysW-gamma-L-lysine aminotransferase
MGLDNYIEMEQKFGPGCYSLKNFRIEKGIGVYLYSSDGTKYLDFMSGHGVAILGHSHPNIVKAIKDQVEKLITLHSSYPTEIRAEFYKLMSEIAPKGLNRIFMCNSGTEAIEGAMKLALACNRQNKKPNIVAMKRAFHGRTLGALSLTFNPEYRGAFEGLLYPPMKFASFDKIESVKECIDENTIAVITELVQGEGGVYPASVEFAKQLREICTEKSKLLIVDEVQSGMGRTGKMFACQHYGIVPDILCTAKGTGSGVPLGTVISREDLWSNIHQGEHASTFGGNALAAAAGVATIKTLLKDNIPENAQKMGSILMKKLKELPQDKIREIRGLGLMIGIQMKTKSAPYIRYCQDQDHVLFLPAGMPVLRMLPPLIINEEHINIAVNAVKNSLENAEK